MCSTWNAENKEGLWAKLGRFEWKSICLQTKKKPNFWSGKGCDDFCWRLEHKIKDLYNIESCGSNKLRKWSSKTQRIFIFIFLFFYEGGYRNNIQDKEQNDEAMGVSKLKNKNKTKNKKGNKITARNPKPWLTKQLTIKSTSQVIYLSKQTKSLRWPLAKHRYTRLL